METASSVDVPEEEEPKGFLVVAGFRSRRKPNDDDGADERGFRGDPIQPCVLSNIIMTTIIMTNNDGTTESVPVGGGRRQDKIIFSSLYLS